MAVRAGLAQEYVKVSRDQAKVCESHIHDQHLQHQVSPLLPACSGPSLVDRVSESMKMRNVDVDILQGWAAALANLEDSVTALEKRFSRFRDTYTAYLDKRDHFREVIDTFDEDLHVLSKIPVLPALLDAREEDSGHGSNSNISGQASNDGSRPPSREPGAPAQGNKTLLDWINQVGRPDPRIRIRKSFLCRQVTTVWSL